MSSWSHGYVADSPYTLAYQPALAPGQIAWVCAMAGVAWQPSPRMAILDIGCGRGLTVNVLAAANPGWNVIGLDYNPAHIAEAQELAEAADLGNAGFVEADLAAMTDAEMDQLPEFDLVTIHGVWSWVADPVRQGIVRLLARRLKPGGACYIGFNVLPGFAADAALQRLIRHLAGLERSGSSEQRVAAVLPAIARLAATKPQHLAQTPMLEKLTDGSPGLNSAYLAHEFMTEHWRPVFFEDLARDLAAAKLEYVGAATLFENIPDLIFEGEQRSLHDGLPQGAPREFLKDLCLQRPFRRDVFVRGVRRVEFQAALDRQVLAACLPMPKESPRIVVPAGVAELAPDMWEPIAAALEQGPISLGELRRRPAGRQPNAAELLSLLAGNGLVLPALRESGPTAETQRFNRALFEMTHALGATEARLALASPVAAAGLPCSWLELALAVQPEAGVPGAPLDGLLARVFPLLDEEGRAPVRAAVEKAYAERPPIWRRFGLIPG
jgi:SAM-dependent methyltransferase